VLALQKVLRTAKPWRSSGDVGNWTPVRDLVRWTST